MEFDAGLSKCHSTMDLEITIDGDLKLVDGVDEMRQRMLIWLGTPQGERLDPNTGCVVRFRTQEIR